MTTTPDPITTAREALEELLLTATQKAADRDACENAVSKYQAVRSIFDHVEKLKAERDEALKKLELAEQAVKRVQSASKAFEIAFTKTHAPDNETVRKAHIVNATIDSEREMNAILTEENTRLTSRLEQAEKVIAPFANCLFGGSPGHVHFSAASQWYKDRQAKGGGS